MSSDITVEILSIDDHNFEAKLNKRLAWDEVSDDSVNAVVNEIIADVRARGDKALVDYCNRFDSLNISASDELEVSPQELEQALQSISQEQRIALEAAAQRIRDFHVQQKPNDFLIKDEFNNELGQRITSLDKVGVYVPGGKASYPSSVLMNIIPAKVAGVQEIIMVVPTPNGERNPLVFAAAALAGADRVFCIGGAQAVAALAYGTELIPRVDKIVGPGNIFVATAKRAVFGQVGIDMIAGPSEILVYCDGKTPASWIAADLFSQAEHDEQAQAILISQSRAYLDEVALECEKLVQSMPRADVIKASFASRSCFIEVQTQEQAIALINRVAPEHLELSVDDPKAMLKDIRHAGAIFMGRFTPEAFGDYCAGPNHVLPTSGTARFSSPLGVYDFIKRTSLIFCDEQGAAPLADIAGPLADSEGLPAHALSARLRGKR